MSGQFSADMVQQGLQGRDVEYCENALAKEGFVPSEVLVQILKRPSDPITKQLQRCLHVWTAAGMAVQPLDDAFGGWIDTARNWQSLLFKRNPQFKYALMVDADVGPPVETPWLLARHDKPVVSACVPSFTKEKGLFLCVAMKGLDGKARFPTLKGVKQMPATGLVEVHNAGTGCLLVRRDVVDKLWERFDEMRATEASAKTALLKVMAGRELDKPDYDSVMWLATRMNFEEDLTGAPFTIPQSVRDAGASSGVMAKGEDICFTDRVRAAGFQIYVDLEVHCYHEKMIALHWPTDAINPDLSYDDWQLTAFDAPVVQV
jgi:hypothetical protein